MHEFIGKTINNKILKNFNILLIKTSNRNYRQFRVSNRFVLLTCTQIILFRVLQKYLLEIQRQVDGIKIGRFRIGIWNSRSIVAIESAWSSVDENTSLIWIVIPLRCFKQHASLYQYWSSRSRRHVFLYLMHIYTSYSSRPCWKTVSYST